LRWIPHNSKKVCNVGINDGVCASRQYHFYFSTHTKAFITLVDSMIAAIVIQHVDSVRMNSFDGRCSEACGERSNGWVESSSCQDGRLDKIMEMEFLAAPKQFA
jgi:hypothetical protein